MRIEDEHGDQWKVSSGDPALPLVNRLKRAGFDYIVLPRRSLTSGAVCAMMVGDLETLEGSSLIRAVRLNDSLAALGGADAPSDD